MAYFTERHGMRKPIERTSVISIEMYSLLFDCCEKYLPYLAKHLPEQCLDGYGCCGADKTKLNIELKFEIPTLYRDSNGFINKPMASYYNSPIAFDQCALLDFIEYTGHNCRDISNGNYHSYFGHYHLNLFESDNIFKDFRKEINSIFEKTGLLFTLTADKVIERIVENSVNSQKIEAEIKTINETGTRELLEEAIIQFRQPNPLVAKNAVEKIWDALERLKTYYTSVDKKTSVGKIVNDISSGQVDFVKLFDKEFKTLTDIGNNFRIRHHETNKIDIFDIKHYDYFFNRCLSLISLAIQYLQEQR
jgi:hypothetical protein